MAFEPINPPQFPTPIAPYSAGAKAGNTVYVSGVLALGEGGVVLHVGDAAAQTRHVLDVIKITLEAAGATLADVAMNHIFLKDLGDYGAFNAVYAEYFPGAKPARYCIKCDLVKPDCLVEIASVVLDQQPPWRWRAGIGGAHSIRYCTCGFHISSRSGPSRCAGLSR